MCTSCGEAWVTLGMCIDLLGGIYGGRTFSTWPDPRRSWRQLEEWRGSVWTFHLNPREMCHGISLLNLLEPTATPRGVVFAFNMGQNNHFTTTAHIGGSERALGLYSHPSLRPLLLAHIWVTCGNYILFCFYIFLSST